MADWFGEQNIEGFGPSGGPSNGGFAPYNGGFEGSLPGPPQTNYEGAGYDPFSYTKGSLLTPWEGKFSYTGGDGGSGVEAFTPFQHAGFDYRAATPDKFNEVYNNPGNFVYGDYKSGPAFEAPTEADMKADPGYAVRMKAGQRALESSKAAQGILKTGGTAKALQKYGQEQGSQEYGNVYGRKAGEYGQRQDERRFSYGTNASGARSDWDRNIGNARQGYQLRQGAWMDNANLALDASRHGYDVATGKYDRNLSLARQQYDDAQSHAARAAAGSAAAAGRSYNQALNEYQMGRDEFWTNQDRQYNILSNEDAKGYRAAGDWAGANADIYQGRANANASGTMGSANARAGMASNIGGTIGGLALYGANQYQNQNPSWRTPPYNPYPNQGPAPNDYPGNFGYGFPS